MSIMLKETTKMTDKKKLTELKKESKFLDAIVRIGKSGITESLIDEISKHLKKRQLIKIKFLKGSIGDSTPKEAAKYIANETNSEIVDVIGLTASFYRAPGTKVK